MAGLALTPRRCQQPFYKMPLRVDKIHRNGQLLACGGHHLVMPFNYALRCCAGGIINVLLNNRRADYKRKR
jgi:hypothetical protein